MQLLHKEPPAQKPVFALVPVKPDRILSTQETTSLGFQSAVGHTFHLQLIYKHVHVSVGQQSLNQQLAALTVTPQKLQLISRTEIHITVNL